MQSGCSLLCALVPLFYSGRGCLVDIITKHLLECSLLCGDLCVLSVLLSSLLCHMIYKAQHLCYLFSPVICAEKECPPVGTARLGDPHDGIAEWPGLCAGQRCLAHPPVLPAGCPWDGCWKGASGSLAAFLSEWPPALKTCPLHLWQVTRSPCQISDRKFKPKVCPKSRDSWGNIPRHVCLLRLGEPGFGAHLHCLSEKCKACSWQCWSPTAALGGTLICEEMWN